MVNNTSIHNVASLAARYISLLFWMVPSVFRGHPFSLCIEHCPIFYRNNRTHYNKSRPHTNANQPKSPCAGTRARYPPTFYNSAPEFSSTYRPHPHVHSQRLLFREIPLNVSCQAPKCYSIYFYAYLIRTKPEERHCRTKKKRTNIVANSSSHRQY